MNEITLVSRLTVIDSGQTDIGDITKQLSLTTAGKKYSSGQATSTTAADLDLGPLVDFNTVGVVWLRNRSTTPGEDILLLKSTVVFARIKPQEAYPFRPEPDGTAWQVKSATGTPELGVMATGTAS